jgi:hypothetical protein
VSVPANFLLSRVTLLAHTIFKDSKKAVYRALFFNKGLQCSISEIEEGAREIKNWQGSTLA